MSDTGSLTSGEETAARSGRRSDEGATDSRLAHRPVGRASAFSTILLAEAIGRVLPACAPLVLDVGGGEAPYARDVEAGTHLAIDRRSPELTLASHQAVGDACELPVRVAIADLVLCTEVVEHVPDDQQLYRELRRVITDDGVLVLSAPFVHGLHESPHDYRRPTSMGLVHGLTGAGFAVDSIDAVGDTRDVAVDQMIRSLAPKVSAAIRRAPPPLARRLESAFRRVQGSAADRSLRRTGTSLSSIDPRQPVPRLTLGYVVRARPA